MTGVKACLAMPTVGQSFFGEGCLNIISRCTHCVEGVCFGHLRIGSLLFADDMVLLALSARYLQLSLNWFVARREATGVDGLSFEKG